VSFLIGADDSSQNIIGSYGLQLSGKFSRGILAFTRHPEFKKVFPHFQGYEPGSKVNLVNGGQIHPCSPGSALTGYSGGSSSLSSEYPGVMILDDPIKNANSTAALKELESWLLEEYLTRITFNYALVVIATRFSIYDAHGLMLEQDGVWDEFTNPDGWRYLNIPALCDDPVNDPLERQPGESLWEDNKNFTAEKLLYLKNNRPESVWESLYQGRPVAGSGGLVKRQHLVELPRALYPERWQFTWISIDSAMSEDQDADESVITVLGIPFHNSSYPDNKIYVRDVFAGNWAFPTLLEQVEYVENLYQPRVIVIEKASSGYSLSQAYESELNTPIETVTPSRSKQVRLQGVLHYFERWRLIFQTDSNWVHKLTKQLLEFPKGKHDDYVDSLVYGLLYYLVNIEGNAEATETVFKAVKPPQRTRTSVVRRPAVKQFWY
jgi:predicted phage terminase large subunit-like protein